VHEDSFQASRSTRGFPGFAKVADLLAIEMKYERAFVDPVIPRPLDHLKQLALEPQNVGFLIFGVLGLQLYGAADNRLALLAELQLGIARPCERADCALSPSGQVSELSRPAQILRQNVAEFRELGGFDKPSARRRLLEPRHRWDVIAAEASGLYGQIEGVPKTCGFAVDAGVREAISLAFLGESGDPVGADVDRLRRLAKMFEQNLGEKRSGADASMARSLVVGK
jgi:hypothetical protein